MNNETRFINAFVEKFASIAKLDQGRVEDIVCVVSVTATAMAVTAASYSVERGPEGRYTFDRDAAYEFLELMIRDLRKEFSEKIEFTAGQAVEFMNHVTAARSE